MFIADFVTQRIKAKMQELTLQQAIDLCQIPDSLNEQGISRALQFIRLRRKTSPFTAEI